MFQINSTNQDFLNQKIKKVRQVLEKNFSDFALIIPKSFLKTLPFVFDFTENNKDLFEIDLNNTQKFVDYVNLKLKKNNCFWGAGGYGEKRMIYQTAELFSGEDEPRSVHLALDLWLPAMTSIFAPLKGIVHSFQVNDNFRDYGPTIILEHQLSDIKFFTLYGHLSLSSTKDLKIGKEIEKGALFAYAGKSNENGQWPPHLHFQIIVDMLGNFGDFPGVAKVSEKKFYLAICPNPNLILRIKNLPLG